jgi:hypothetical protein
MKNSASRGREDCQKLSEGLINVSPYQKLSEGFIVQKLSEK